jgi:predicted branched-subunit amino acid permease
MNRWPDGLRASLPTALPTAAVGVSFGLLAAPALGAVPTVAMSVLVWSGTAQFAAVTGLLAGAGPAVAIGTGLLANARFLPMGFAIAPSMNSRPVRRAAVGVLLADASFAIGHRSSGRFDVTAIAWAMPVQYLAWVAGTAAGAAGAGVVGDPERWGLDVLFPVFYLSLLMPELGLRRPDREPGHRTDRRPLAAAVLAAFITVALTPLAPPGVPVLAAALAAALGLRRLPADGPAR